MQYLVMKHFDMDDIPVLLTTSEDKAVALVAGIERKMEIGDVFATEEEQHLIGADIGSELICVSITEFRGGIPILMEKSE